MSKMLYNKSIIIINYYRLRKCLYKLLYGLYINIIPLVNLPASEFSSSTPPSLKHEYDCKHSKKNIYYAKSSTT